MGYYIRILTKNNKRIPLLQLKCCLKIKRIKAIIKVEKGNIENWIQLSLKHVNEEEIAIIESNPITKDSVGEEEINEFLKELVKYKPNYAAKWLNKYLKKVRIVYSFQILKGAYKNNGWDIVRTIQNELWSNLGGILQSDNEGFSNEEGYHILWQFPSNVKGPWQMAILDKNGKWTKFEMDLGNKYHRKAFLSGNVPKGVKIIE